MSSELKALWESAGGKVPDDWEIVPLEKLFRDAKSIAVGVMYPGDHSPGGVPLIKVGDIKSGIISAAPDFCISEATNHEYRRSQLVGDELLITLVGNPGECVVVTPAMAGWNPARAIAVMKLKDSGLRTYVKTVLESSAGRHLIDSVLNTTVQKTLNLKDIRRLPIPMPSRGTIKNISDMAEAFSDRITLLRETNTTLEAIAQAMFKSWFVDFDPVRAKMQGRAPEGMDESTAALFPDSFEESVLGPVPKGWHIGRLDDLLVLQRGFDLPAQDRTPGDFPIIAASGPSGTHHKAMVKGPGVVTGRSGVLGKVFLELEDFWPLNTTLWVKEFKAATPCYAYEVLRLLDFKSFNAGSAVPSLNRNHIHGLPYLLPARECVDTFEVIASQIHKRCRVNEKQIQSLVDIRDALLPRLISGQLISEHAMKEICNECT
jgi:type I restriction enzyme, S subunit